MSEVTDNPAIWLPIRNRRYYANRGGHAPGYLRGALVEAFDDAFGSSKPWWELLEIELFDPEKQSWWDQATGRQRGEWLLGQLWNCTDIVSGYAFPDIDLPRGRTFARVARTLKTEMIELAD